MNTPFKKKKPFTPLSGEKVGMYVCGVTVYDFSHIGHARSMIVFDVISRFIRRKGYELTYVRNFTDVDDKIIARANTLGTSYKEIADRYIDEFNTDMTALKVKHADVEPRATDYIPQIIELVRKLEEKGLAYKAQDGSVYYSVSKFREYGKLSGRRLEEMIAGARVDIEEQKRDPLDFALWKRSKEGEPSWESPWSKGRPGWHIECSAMSTSILGPTLDIHGGGRDLIFPHHENEIAQSKAPTGFLASVLGPQRLRDHKRREDEQVARQLPHHPRARGRGAPGVFRLLLISALPHSHQLLERGDPDIPAGPRPFL